MFKIVLAGIAALTLSGCTSAQIGSGIAITSKYQTDVASACAIAKDALASPLATLALATVPAVAQAANLVTSSCTTEAQIANLVADPLSVAWLGTLSTTLKTGGKTVLPPPVSP